MVLMGGKRGDSGQQSKPARLINHFTAMMSLENDQ